MLTRVASDWLAVAADPICSSLPPGALLARNLIPLHRRHPPLPVLLDPHPNQLQSHHTFRPFTAPIPKIRYLVQEHRVGIGPELLLQVLERDVLKAAGAHQLDVLALIGVAATRRSADEIVRKQLLERA